MVIRAGWGNTQTSLLELADVTIDDEVKNSIRRAATKAVRGDPSKGVDGLQDADQVTIKDIQGIKSGQNYLVDVEVTVPRSWTLDQTAEVEEAIRTRTGAKVRGVRRVRVKFTPSEGSSNDFASEFIGADVSPRSSPEPEDEHNHSHESGHTHGHESSKKQR